MNTINSAVEVWAAVDKMCDHANMYSYEVSSFGNVRKLPHPESGGVSPCMLNGSRNRKGQRLCMGAQTTRRARDKGER